MSNTEPTEPSGEEEATGWAWGLLDSNAETPALPSTEQVQEEGDQTDLEGEEATPMLPETVPPEDEFEEIVEEIPMVTVTDEAQTEKEKVPTVADTALEPETVPGPSEAAALNQECIRQLQMEGVRKRKALPQPVDKAKALKLAVPEPVKPPSKVTPAKVSLGMEKGKPAEPWRLRMPPQDQTSGPASSSTPSVQEVVQAFTDIAPASEELDHYKSVQRLTDEGHRSGNLNKLRTLMAAYELQDWPEVERRIAGYLGCQRLSFCIFFWGDCFRTKSFFLVCSCQLRFKTNGKMAQIYPQVYGKMRNNAGRDDKRTYK